MKWPSCKRAWFCHLNSYWTQQLPAYCHAWSSCKEHDFVTFVTHKHWKGRTWIVVLEGQKTTVAGVCPLIAQERRLPCCCSYVQSKKHMWSTLSKGSYVGWVCFGSLRKSWENEGLRNGAPDKAATPIIDCAPRRCSWIHWWFFGFHANFLVVRCLLRDCFFFLLLPTVCVMDKPYLVLESGFL